MWKAPKKSIWINPVLTAITSCQNSSYKNWWKFSTTNAMLVFANERDTFLTLLQTPGKEIDWKKKKKNKEIQWIIISLTRPKTYPLNNMVPWISVSTSEDITHESNFSGVLKKETEHPSGKKFTQQGINWGVTFHRGTLPVRFVLAFFF